MRTTMIIVTALAALTAMIGGGCGGTKPTPQTGGGDGDGEAWTEASADDPDMIPPERMDEIKSILDRKRAAAARCFALVVNSGTVDKNSRGHLSLSFIIDAGGKPTQVRVLEDSLNSPELEHCVIEKVEQIDFGALPKPLDWSYTFAFESM